MAYMALNLNHGAEELTRIRMSEDDEAIETLAVNAGHMLGALAAINGWVLAMFWLAGLLGIGTPE
jgi:hypothetical protein